MGLETANEYRSALSVLVRERGVLYVRAPSGGIEAHLDRCLDRSASARGSNPIFVNGVAP